MMGRLRYLVKRLLCRLGIPFEEPCQCCGWSVGVTWHAPNELWLNVVGSLDGTTLCPRCFAERAFHRLGYGVIFEARLLGGGE